MSHRPDLESQIACVKREIAMRARVYPALVDSHKMSSAKASLEQATMQAVLDTLLALQRLAAAAELMPVAPDV